MQTQGPFGSCPRWPSGPHSALCLPGGTPVPPAAFADSSPWQLPTLRSRPPPHGQDPPSSVPRELRACVRQRFADPHPGDGSCGAGTPFPASAPPWAMPSANRWPWLQAERPARVDAGPGASVRRDEGSGTLPHGARSPLCQANAVPHARLSLWPDLDLCVSICRDESFVFFFFSNGNLEKVCSCKRHSFQAHLLNATGSSVSQAQKPAGMTWRPAKSPTHSLFTYDSLIAVAVASSRPV